MSTSPGVVHEFDQVFHRRDVAVLGFVQVVVMPTSVVGLPEPVGPGDQHRPARRGARSWNTLGALSCSSVRDLGEWSEHGARTPRFWLKR